MLYFLESIAGVCTFYPKGTCTKGGACPFRHIRGDRTIVCKHWLRGLCKKGDQCEFLHEYDMTKMPECYFYSRFSKYSHNNPNYEKKRKLNIFFLFQMLVIIKNAPFFILILKVKLKIVHGMIEDFVGMVLIVGTDMFVGFYVWII